MSTPAGTRNGDGVAAPATRRFARRDGGGEQPDGTVEAGPGGRGPSRIVAGGTALVALVSGLIALGFVLRPDLKPDPRDEIGARATVLAVERNVTVTDWLRRTSSSPHDFDARRRVWLKRGAGTKIHGELAYVRISVRGFKRREVRLRWSVYKQSKQERRRQGGAGGEQETTVRLEAPVDDLVVEQWLGPVPGPEKYFVRFEVRTPNGALLDVADSKPFRGL